MKAEKVSFDLKTESKTLAPEPIEADAVLTALRTDFLAAVFFAAFFFFTSGFFDEFAATGEAGLTATEGAVVKGFAAIEPAGICWKLSTIFTILFAYKFMFKSSQKREWALVEDRH